MMTPSLSHVALATILAVAGAGPAWASGSPIGTWIDQTGAGAIEISDCKGQLCARVVWLKSADKALTCQLQIIGEVRAVAKGQWDGVWIYDPDSKR